MVTKGKPVTIGGGDGLVALPLAIICIAIALVLAFL